MNNVITLEYFENNTVIDTDFSLEKAEIHLIEAHEIQLWELLDEKLYNRVQLILDDLPNADQIEKDLITCLQPFMVKSTEVNLVPFLNFPITAKGTTERRGDFTSPAPQPEKSRILNVVRGREEFYAQKCRDFLIKNINEFPEYNCGDSSQDFYSSIYAV